MLDLIGYWRPIIGNTFGSCGWKTAGQTINLFVPFHRNAFMDGTFIRRLSRPFAFLEGCPLRLLYLLQNALHRAAVLQGD